MADGGYSVRFNRLAMFLAKINVLRLYHENYYQGAQATKDYPERIFQMLNDALQKIYAKDWAWSSPAWAAATAYSRTARVFPPNGYQYIAENAGTSGGVEPAWPTTIDATIVDNDITWRCLGLQPLVEWDRYLAMAIAVNGTEKSGFEAVGNYKNWVNGATVAVDDLVYLFAGSGNAVDGFWKLQLIAKATVAGTLGDVPDILSLEPVTRGSSLTNSGGTATMIVEWAGAWHTDTTAAHSLSGFGYFQRQDNGAIPVTWGDFMVPSPYYLEQACILKDGSSADLVYHLSSIQGKW